MSNWKQSHHEERQAFNAWRTVLKVPGYQKTNSDTMKKFNELQSRDCNSNTDHKVWTPTHPICNQFLTQYPQYAMNDRENEEYKISSSLKTIWNDVSDSKPTTSINQRVMSINGASQQMKNVRQAPLSEHVNYAIPVGSEMLEKSSKISNSVLDNATNVANSFNGNSNSPNSLKGRAITARSGSQCSSSSYVSACGTDNDCINQSCSYLPVPIANQHNAMLLPNSVPHSDETFLQSLKLIVHYGFLDAKILYEPIAPDTYEMLNMLIFYVMEYRRTRNYASDNNPAVFAEMKNISYKINLIRNEITKIQVNFIEHRRHQQEILQRHRELSTKQYCQTFFNQFKVPMATEENNRCNRIANRINTVPTNSCANVPKADVRQNQRFIPRQFDQFAQQENANMSSAKYTFLPKAKNIDNRFFYDQNNSEYSRKDVRSFGIGSAIN